MNSIRQDILKQIGLQLSYISTANGYSNTLPDTRIYRGYKSINEVNEYPCAFYMLGNEKLEHSEAYEIQQADVEVVIGVYLQSATGQGKLTDESEEWIKDFKRFISGNKNVSKVLNLTGIQGVEMYYIENILPYIIDHGRNIGGVIIEMIVKHNETIYDDL